MSGKYVNVAGIQRAKRSVALIRAWLFMLLIIVLGLCAGGCGGDNSTSSNETGVRVKATLYTQWLYAGEYDLLWDNSSTTFQLTYGSAENFAAYAQSFLEQLGKETDVLDERVISIQSARLYERSASFEQISIPVSIEWLLDDDLKIILFDCRALPDEAPSQFEDYRTKTDLRLPFDDEWLVIWGGRSIRDNYHADTPNQRFAYDFLVMRDGLYYSGDGSRNEDYYGFGQPIVAPGAGVVLSTESSIPDNLPGEENWDQADGNYVLIDHENGEYSFLAHFRQGTVTVRSGDRVVAGQLLGQCGNSGGSDLPHLHYHLQNTPDFDDNMGAAGLPIQFQAYRANGRFVERGEPTRGQLVQPQ